MRIIIERSKKRDYSKYLADIRRLLWIVTLSGIALAVYCIHEDFLGGLPWVSAMVGLPWTAHGVVVTAYLNMAKSDHREGGITFEKAKANGFKEINGTSNNGSTNSPGI